MAIDFIKLTTTKSNDELEEYIKNRKKYQPMAIYAVIDELKQRGRNFSDEEFTQIANDTTDLKSQIDQLVYQLYHLTEEEIKIVEGQ